VTGKPGVVPKAEIRALADRNVFLIPGQRWLFEPAVE
jgi:hypothetical protein